MRAEDGPKKLLGAIAVLAAVLVAGSIAFVGTFTDTYPVKGSWVVLTVVVILDLTNRERMIIRSLHRALGSLLGAGIGIAIVSLMTVMGITSTLTLLFQWFAIVVIALACGIACKWLPYHKYIFVLILFTVAIAIYPPLVRSAVQWLVSVCIGAALAVITVILYRVPPASQTVLDMHSDVIASSLDFAEIAINSPASGQLAHGRPAQITVLYRASRELECAYDCLEHYEYVHKWLRLNAEHLRDLHELSSASRLLYHKAHNVLLTFTIGGTSEMFQQPQFCDHFGYHFLRLKELLLDIRADLKLLHLHRPLYIKDYLSGATSNLSLLADVAETVGKLYQKNYDLLDNIDLRWRVVSFLITITPFIFALASYIQILTKIQNGPLTTIDALILRLREIVRNGPRLAES